MLVAKAFWRMTAVDKNHEFPPLAMSGHTDSSTRGGHSQSVRSAAIAAQKGLSDVAERYHLAINTHGRGSLDITEEFAVIA